MKLKYGQRLFISVAILLVAFFALFVSFQLYREYHYKETLMRARLQDYNVVIADDYLDGTLMPNHNSLYTRFTQDMVSSYIVAPGGRIMYDSSGIADSAATVSSVDPFLEQSLREGDGKTLIKEGNSYEPYRVYVCTNFPSQGFSVVSTIPLNKEISKFLHPDIKPVLLFTGLFMLVLLYLFFRTKGITRNVAREMSRLNAELSYRFDQNTLLKKQMTQNVAHELKTPLSSIMGFLETIRSDPEMDPEMKADFIERSYQQSVRLSNVLRDVSLLGGMENNAKSFEKEKIDVSAIVDEIMTSSEWRLKEKDMTMMNLISKGAYVTGNRSLIHSIFRNLTDNAIAYAGEGTSILVKLIDSTRKQVTFSFSDNGVGVPQEHLPNLFQRFYRVDKGRSRKLGGTGLGLAIVKNAVLLHGGRVYAQKSGSGGLEIIFSLDK